VKIYSGLTGKIVEGEIIATNVAHLIERNKGKKDVQFSNLCYIENEKGVSGVEDIFKHGDSGTAVVNCETNKLVGIYMGMSIISYVYESEAESVAESEEVDEFESEAGSEVVDVVRVYISPVVL